jgi:ABC-2 type transport system permease protein
MAVYKRGYQRYQGTLTTHWTRVLAFPRFAWRRLAEQRLVAIVLMASFFWPLLCAGFIYLSNHSELWEAIGPGLARLLEINGNFFLVFINVQSFFAMVLAALAGPGLVAPDLANNALPLYFSRPLSRLDYVVSRLLVLAGMLSLVTWVPGLLLFFMQAGMARSGWLWTNWRLGVGLAAVTAIWVLLLSLVALASSAYVRWRVIAGALVLGFFFVLAGVAALLNAVLRVEWGSVLDPGRTIGQIWCSIVGMEGKHGLGTFESSVALIVTAALLCWVLERKLRPVEVVS